MELIYICSQAFNTFNFEKWAFLVFLSVRLLSVLRGHSVFSSPPQWPMTSDFERIFYTRSYPLHYFLILFLEKEPVFPFSMLSAKQVNYLYHFHNVFGMTRSLTGDLNPGPPALEASTIPLCYRGGGRNEHKFNQKYLNWLRPNTSCLNSRTFISLFTVILHV